MGKTRQSANLVSDNNIFVDITNDRVGIKTTIPQFDLDIIGDVNISGSLNQNGSVFSSGVGIQSAGTIVGSGITTLNFIGAGNTFAVNGNTIDISISGGGGASSQWVTTASGIHTLSNVGIGTTNPTEKLNVYSTDLTKVVIAGDGSSTSAASLIIQSNDSGSNFRGHGVFYYDSTSDIEWFSGRPYNGNDAFSIHRKTSVTSPGSDTANKSNLLFIIESAGDVGIGTDNPTSKLEVSGVIKDAGGNVRAIPNNDKTTSYTLTADDVGELINITTGGVTVPASVFSAGNSVTIYNNSGSSQTITQGASTTLRLAGTSTTGNRTLAQRGITTIMCVAANEFVISGAGLS